MILESLNPLQMTKHRQSGQLNLLHTMGVLGPDGRPAYFNKATNSYDVIGLMRHLADYAKNLPRDIAVAQFESAFKKQGGRFAMMASDPKFLKLLDQTMNYIQHGPSMDTMQARYMANLPGRLQQFTTNFRNVFIELAWPWMKQLAETFHGWADKLHDFQQWLHTHRDAEKAVGVGVAGVAVTGSAVGALMMAGISGQILNFATGGFLGRVLGPLAVQIFGPLAAGLVAIGRAALPLLGPAGAIIGIAIALYELNKHSHDIARAIGVATAWLTNKGWPIVQHAITTFFNDMVALLSGDIMQIAPKVGAAVSGSFLSGVGLKVVNGQVVPMTGTGGGPTTDFGIGNPIMQWLLQNYPGLKGAFDKGHAQGTVDFGAPGTPAFRRALKAFLDTKAAVGRQVPGNGWNNPQGQVVAPSHSGRQQTREVGHTVVVEEHFHYHAPAGEDDVTARRRAAMHAKDVAGKVGQTLADLLRTTTGAGAPAGPSKYEQPGAVPA